MATQKQQKEFIEKIAPLIREEAKKRGYLVASPIIAQAICESGWGLSTLASKYHNYFGLKCGSSWKGASVNMATKEEYTAGTLTSIRDNFRAYSDIKAGVAGYFDFIQYSRYANLKTASTPREYLERIKADGYATSSTYVNTNMNIVTNYNLTVYDDFTAAAVATPTPAPAATTDNSKYKAGKNYVTTVNLYVRKAPNGAKKTLKELTADGRKHAYADKQGKAILKKNTTITCNRAELETNGDIWLQIPSGWICAKQGKETYIK